MDDIRKYKIFLDKRPEGIRDENGNIRQTNASDFFITVPIFRDIELDDYVDVEIDPFRLQVERQEINPYFMELGLFEDIENIEGENNSSVIKKSSNYNIDINK